MELQRLLFSCATLLHLHATTVKMLITAFFSLLLWTAFYPTSPQPLVHPVDFYMTSTLFHSTWFFFSPFISTAATSSLFLHLQHTERVRSLNPHLSWRTCSSEPCLSHYHVPDQGAGPRVSGLHGSAGVWKEAGSDHHAKEVGYPGGPQEAH